MMVEGDWTLGGERIMQYTDASTTIKNIEKILKEVKK